MRGWAFQRNRLSGWVKSRRLEAEGQRSQAPNSTARGGVGSAIREARRERPPACSYTGMRYTFWMIRSFGDKRTETLFWDGVVREFRSIAPRAKRKLEAVNAASRLEDLKVPPSNRLEKLKGNLSGFHSIRVNDQWRIIFKWLNGEPHAVQIVDYH